MPDTVSILRLPAVCERTGLCRSSIYGLIQRQQFPPAVRLTDRAVGWRSDEIDLWIAGRTQANPGAAA